MWNILDFGQAIHFIVRHALERFGFLDSLPEFLSRVFQPVGREQKIALDPFYYVLDFPVVADLSPRVSAMEGPR